MHGLFDSEDARLIAQTRGGNLAAFEKLYHKYKGQVYRTALAVTRDRTAADDIVQDCFLRVHAYIDRLDGERTLAPWLYRVTVNLSYNWLAKGRRLVPLLDEVIEQMISPRPQSLQLHAERGELHRQVADALDQLSFEHRVVIVLFYLNEFSLEEISYILEVPVGTVKSRLHYARERLRSMLAKREPLFGKAATI